jgi:hypothetical protein
MIEVLKYSVQISATIGISIGKTKRVYLVYHRSPKPALTRAQSLLRENMRLIEKPTAKRRVPYSVGIFVTKV